MNLEEEFEKLSKEMDDSFSSRTPAIRVSKLRLLFLHPAIGCLSKLALILAIMTLAIGLLTSPVFSILTGIPFLLALVVLFLATKKQAQIYEQALLIPSLVVSSTPLQILALANMNTDATDKCIMALQLKQFSKIPNHSGKVGEIVPCAAGFHGDDLDKWDNFSIHPLSFATGNIQALKDNVDTFESDEMDLLHQHIQRNEYPKEQRELLWIENVN